ncbi:S1 family peptidase [Arthrobacter sp. GN70]|uniref:Uncharacterized protein n=1 Tax=Arthrobacter terricola TaxID=2547396 RepID=A0A4R5K739_9MICC|nr:S1 family peptidase [Arthrobacter sp. GN70]TDF89472.1 hypothetical protein E1809_22965 [Arthrobacter terricola]
MKKTPVPASVPVHAVAPSRKKPAPSSTATLAASLTPSNIPPFIDSEPYYGGDRIVSTQVENGINYVVQCTVSAPYVNSSTVYMMSAGHCGPTGTAWNQGYFDGSNIYISGSMGTASSVQWGNNRIDGALLTGASYAPYIWTDGANYVSAHVTGAATVVPKGVNPGTGVCTDGSFTGYACGGTVSFTNACANISEGSVVYYVCGLDIADSATPIVQSGDSGGPVVVPTSGGVLMAGTISAQSNGGKEVLFSDVNYLQQVFAVSVAS